jgi:NDP-sugar pyrophosphorylase family protein
MDCGGDKGGTDLFEPAGLQYRISRSRNRVPESPRRISRLMNTLAHAVNARTTLMNVAFVYVVELPDGVKIGFTKEVNNRLKTFRGFCPSLHVINAFFFRSEAEARLVERFLHALFSEDLITNELFDLSVRSRGAFLEGASIRLIRMANHWSVIGRLPDLEHFHTSMGLAALRTHLTAVHEVQHS